MLAQIKKIIYLGGKSKDKDAPSEDPEATKPTPEFVVLGDITAPIIEHIDDFSSEVAPDDTAIWYGPPVAVDDTDGPVEVSCTPEPGSIFAEGTTTVTCAAHDAAGNTATSTFTIGIVVVEPAILRVLAAQSDMSHVCDDQDWGGWRNCYVGPESSVYTTNLGNGIEGTLDSLTIAKDINYGEINASHPWLITIKCFTDASYSEPCSDWLTPGPATKGTTHTVAKTARESSDGIYWHAYFAYEDGRDSNAEYPFGADGSSPVFFNPAYYYRLSIDDQEWPTGVLGSLTEPYWSLKGWH